MTATSGHQRQPTTGTIRNPGHWRRRRRGALDRSRRRAPHRGSPGRSAARLAGPRRQGPGQGAGPVRGLARRSPRRDRGPADQGDRQVAHRRRPRGADAGHHHLVLDQDHGEGARAGDPAGADARAGDQEDQRALPAAPGRRDHRAVELPGRQRDDGRARRAGRGLRGAAEAVRTHAADRRGAGARLAGVGCARRVRAGSGRPRGRRGRHRQRRLHPLHRVRRRPAAR